MLYKHTCIINTYTSYIYKYTHTDIYLLVLEMGDKHLDSYQNIINIIT